jgi:hypothetical protein
MMDRQAAVMAAEAAIASKTPEPAKAEVPEAPAPAVTPDPPPAPEPPAAVVVDDHDDDEHEDSAASDNGADPTAPRKNKGVGKRINELTREKHEERRRAEQALAEANYWRELAQKAQPQPQAAPTQPQGKPTLEQYGNDWNAYEEARDNWVLNQARETFTKERQRWEQEQQQVARQARFAERVAAFEREVPGGWQQAVSAPVETTPVMLDAIADSEIGPKIGYYLAQNLDEALSISRLPPLQQAVAMGRIEAKLLSAPPPPPRPTVTRAPAPPPPIPSGASSGVPARLNGIEDHIAVVQAKRKAKYG